MINRISAQTNYTAFMASLAERGLSISKNIIFSVLTSKAARLLGKPGKIALVLHDAYKKLTSASAEKSGFAQVKDMMFTLIRLIRSYASGQYRQVSTKTVLIGLATVLYLLLPIDLVPDFIPMLGLMDDLSLITWFIKAFQQELVKFQLWESQQALPA
jgi:uncharacterized membrane protein YkvA (DUF1232 family)